MDSNTIIQAVKGGSLVGVKQLLEEGEDPDDVDEDGNTGLHHAVIGEHYNIAVLLLNSGAGLEVRNKDGLNCLQLAQRLAGRTVFSIAIQLTRRNRLEQEKLEQKHQLISQGVESGGEDGDEESDEDGGDGLERTLQTTQHSLTSARRLLTDLESQVCSARSLVNQLELEVSRLKVNVERRKKRNRPREENSRKIRMSDVERCSICLEVPRPPLKVYQCPEGHSFCEDCKNRSDMTNCPECRISLNGVSIRNRTLERLIQLHYDKC